MRYLYGINTTQGKKGEKKSSVQEREVVNDKAPKKKKTNQGFHDQVPFVDDSKEKKMVPFVDNLMA